MPDGHDIQLWRILPPAEPSGYLSTISRTATVPVTEDTCKADGSNSRSQFQQSPSAGPKIIPKCMDQMRDFLPKMGTTVDGQNPAPPRMMIIPLFIGFQPSQVVQDFFHQQYVTFLLVFFVVLESGLQICFIQSPSRFTFFPLEVEGAVMVRWDEKKQYPR